MKLKKRMTTVNELLTQFELVKDQEDMFSHDEIKFIIDNLGGINQIFELCMTSESYVTKSISQENVNNLAKIVNEKVTDKTLSLSLNPTLNKFYKTKIIFAINATNNLYFKYLPFNIASYIYYNILLNKKFVVITMTLSILFVIANAIMDLTIDATDKLLKTIDMSFWLLGLWTWSFVAILYGLRYLTVLFMQYI